MISGYERPAEIRELFTEYTDLLARKAPEFRTYLELQKYDTELEHLEEKYGPPHGRLYLAHYDDMAAGCIALRKINHEVCEMKRLYVRPQFRGRRLGERLVCKIIADAQEIGYRAILLDTLPFLESALAIYRRLGFYEVPRYNDNPLSNSIFMRLDLCRK